MEDKFLQFDKYITKELSLAEESEFEILLKNDSTLKAEFENYKETYTFLENKFENETDLNDFKKNLEKISNAHFEKKPSSKNKFMYLGLVASIALLVGLFLFNNQNPPTYQEFVAYPTADFTVRSTNETSLMEAQKSFNNKDFEKANELFTGLLSSDSDNNELKLYKAFSLLELSRFKESDSLLKELSSGNSSYKTKATWYLALSKLKQEKYSDCKKILETIPEGFIEYKKVQKLLKKLPN